MNDREFEWFRSGIADDADMAVVGQWWEQYTREVLAMSPAERVIHEAELEVRVAHYLIQMEG